MQSKKRKTQGGTSANAKKTPLFKQVWFWMLIVAVVAYIGILLWRNPITKPDTNETGSTETYPEINYITCKVGETFDANGMHITYLGVETWLPEGETEHPDDACCFIRLKIAAENKASENREIYADEFTCYADNVKAFFEYFKGEKLPEGIVAPGERVEGYLYYTVPTEASTIEVKYTSYLTWRNNFAILPVDLSK